MAPVDGVLREVLLRARVVADVRLLKDVVQRVGDVSPFLQAPCVGERIAVDDAVLGMARYKTPHRMRPDAPRPGR